MLTVITLNVTYKPFILSVVMLNVIMLSVMAPSKDILESPCGHFDQILINFLGLSRLVQ